MPDMPGMPMPEMCNMNMVWNWDTTNLCILTSSWRITTPFSLYVSLAFIAFAGVLYEWLRLYIRRLDAKLARRSSISSSSSLLAGGGHRRRASLLLPTSNPSSSSSSLLGGVGDGGSTTSGRRGINVSKRRSLSTATGSSGNRFDDREEDEEDRGRLKKWVKPLETSHTAQIWRSTLHATSIGISFILMLIGMTFNAWIIMAIIAGKSPSNVMRIFKPFPSSAPTILALDEGRRMSEILDAVY